MPCIATTYNPSIGPLLQVAIFPPSSLGTSPLPAITSGPHLYMALVDTGASSTCISTKIVNDLALPPTGKMPVAGVHGSMPANTYQFIVGFILPQRQDATGTILANITPFPVDGIEFANIGCGFDVLLGRDVLCRGQLTLSFSGQFVICF
jgi:hypothetical protein